MRSQNLTLRRSEDGVEDVLDGIVVGAEVVRRPLRVRGAGREHYGHEDDGEREKTKDEIRGSDFNAAAAASPRQRRRRKKRRSFIVGLATRPRPPSPPPMPMAVMAALVLLRCRDLKMEKDKDDLTASMLHLHLMREATTLMRVI